MSTTNETHAGHDRTEEMAAAADHLYQKYSELREQLRGVIVGLDDPIEQIMIGVLCRSHCILEGMPGLAKTMLVASIASLLDLQFRRIQFTPDLMPSDISGADVLEEDRATGKRVFRFIQGPVFGNIILADEINRTPPKTQSALLEAMQERQLTIGGTTYPLPDPFFVLATQNPIETEGTYPLPEAQLDRFLFHIKLTYPTREAEREICHRQTTDYRHELNPVVGRDSLLKMQELVEHVAAADRVYDYALDLARRSRPEENQLPRSLQGMIQWGAGPRASINMIRAAKARALLHHRFHATTDDVHAVAHATLRHRIIRTFNAEAEELDTDHIVTQLIESARSAGNGDR